MITIKYHFKKEIFTKMPLMLGYDSDGNPPMAKQYIAKPIFENDRPKTKVYFEHEVNRVINEYKKMYYIMLFVLIFVIFICMIIVNK
jgi:hypothetical protein